MSTSHSRTVVKSYQRYYDDPVTLAKGDQVRITKRDLWEDRYVWLWCINTAQKEGWVPRTYLAVNGETGEALKDYSAWELSVLEGQSVKVLYQESGWFWCESEQGEQGWIPVNCLSGD